MRNKILKKKLKNNNLTIGSWITIGHPSIPEILSNAGFEWLVIDMEHNSIDKSMMQNLISVIQSKNIAALVRVDNNEEVSIKHALDAGADGIIIPMVNNIDDAMKAIEYAKYPPIGKRGVGLSRAQNYGYDFEDYKKWQKENLVIIAQIEHINGVNNLREIIGVDGIDAVIIGPYDLSGSLGYPGDFTKLELQNALNNVINICKESSFSLGYHVVDPNPELVKSKIKEGYNFIAFSTDFYFMGNNSIEMMNKLKK